MALYSEVRAAIRKAAIAALSEYTNPLVIFSNSNGAEPAESYVVVNILGTTQQGRHSTSTFTNANEEITIQSFNEMMVQFSFIGSLSGEMSHSFSQRINNNPVALQELNKYKIGIMRKSNIRRSPQKRDTKWVEYHNIDVTFNYAANTQEKFDVVEALVFEDNLSETPLIFSVPPGIIYP